MRICIVSRATVALWWWHTLGWLNWLQNVWIISDTLGVLDNAYRLRSRGLQWMGQGPVIESRSSCHKACKSCCHVGAWTTKWALSLWWIVMRSQRDKIFIPFWPSFVATSMLFEHLLAENAWNTEAEVGYDVKFRWSLVSPAKRCITVWYKDEHLGLKVLQFHLTCGPVQAAECSSKIIFCIFVAALTLFLLLDCWFRQLVLLACCR